MIFFYQFLFILATYFIAGIPFGLLLGKLFAKVDIRELGSKNIGATNATRILGKKLGFLTLILDSLKGMLMVIIARFSFYQVDNLHLFLVIVSFVAISAHIYPIYLKFKGGKGVSTAIGTIMALDFSVGILAICFWILTFVSFRIAAIASLVAIFSTTIFSTAYDAPFSQIIFCWAVFLLIFMRHRENIIRILTGEEKKI
jgi:glycerol-3-phosphate acyltransferase PlsY